MDFQITKEQKQIVRETINFARANLNSEESLDFFSTEMWKKTSKFGLFGLTISNEYDGLGESYLTAALVIEALGYACLNNGFVFAVNNHIWVGLNLIYIYASDLLKNKYLKRMVAGELIGAIAITEADAGSDAMAMSASIQNEGDYYRLNGSKIFISNGPIADIYIVFAKLNHGHESGITALVVEKAFDGVIVSKEIEKMGLDSCPMSEVTFLNCKVPKENLLGSIGKGGNIMSAALEWERCYEFACHVGAMQRVMEKCITYAEERSQFGKKIGENQSISHKIANMKMSIELSKLMLYKIAWLKDQSKSAYLDTSIFKLYVSENYVEICRNAMQILGAYGYTKEYGMEREMRDALSCSIYSGTSEIQRNTIYTLSKSILL